LYTDKGANGVVSKCYPESMFIDAFRPGNEVPAELLKANLNRIGIPSDRHAQYLKPISTADLLLRTGSNIVESCHYRFVQANWRSRHTPVEEPDTDLAYYSTVWVPTLLSNPSQGSDLTFRLATDSTLVTLCDFLRYYPWDADLIEDYVIPLFAHRPQYKRLVEAVKTAQFEDLARPQVKRRRSEIDVKVKYKIGQVFTHRRYEYEAMIIGWDTCCEMGEDWIEQMGVDGLSGGRKQSFYTVLSVHGPTHLIISG
jgi:F-box protein 21